jgi:hypothetical protein
MKLGTFKNINWNNVALLAWVQLGLAIPTIICLIVLGVIG